MCKLHAIKLNLVYKDLSVRSLSSAHPLVLQTPSICFLSPCPSNEELSSPGEKKMVEINERMKTKRDSRIALDTGNLHTHLRYY